MKGLILFGFLSAFMLANELITADIMLIAVGVETNVFEVRLQLLGEFY